MKAPDLTNLAEVTNFLLSTRMFKSICNIEPNPENGTVKFHSVDFDRNIIRIDCIESIHAMSSKSKPGYNIVLMFIKTEEL